MSDPQKCMCIGQWTAGCSLHDPDLIVSKSRTYTEQEHQAEIAALVRKVVDTFEEEYCKHDSSLIGVMRGFKAMRALLTPPMQSALAEHEVGIRAECNGEWLNMIVRLFGPIPCGGTSLEIAERHLTQVEAKVRFEGESFARETLQLQERKIAELEAALAEAQKAIKYECEQKVIAIEGCSALQGALRLAGIEARIDEVTNRRPHDWQCACLKEPLTSDCNCGRDKRLNELLKQRAEAASATALLEGK